MRLNWRASVSVPRRPQFGHAISDGCPFRSSSRRRGELLTEGIANQRHLNKFPAHSPPYKAASAAAEGKVSSKVQLVRVYRDGVNKPEGAFTAPKSEIDGLTPKQIQDKLALENTPTHVVDVKASGVAARVGIVRENFGQVGGGIQVELLERGARFENARPIGGVFR